MKRNLAMVTDFYKLTMYQGYFKSEKADQKVVFDYFYRRNPNDSGYCLFAGLEHFVEYIKKLKFTEDDIQYLRDFEVFEEDFLKHLLDFKFTSDIYAVPEGTIVFPHEPIIRISGPLAQVQLIETTMLNLINYSTLIATEGARTKHAAGDDLVLEFGTRRAQGPDASVMGARAAVIGGCDATSNVLAGKSYGIPVAGTHDHGWVMAHNSELEAFREYVKLYPKRAILLVDTYDTLQSGVPNAITVFKELQEQGKELAQYGIRLDSGDLARLSKDTKKMLDEAGFSDADVVASGDLDALLIQQLKQQGAKINVWGVGTNLITSKKCPALGGVYKLGAEIQLLERKEVMIPKIKVSDNPAKITNPGYKKIIRVYHKKTGKMVSDIIALVDEEFNEKNILMLHDETHTWKRKTLKPGKYILRELLKPIFIEGECVYELPSTMEIKEYAKKEMDTLWDEHKRLVNPHPMHINLSDKLYELKKDMIYQESFNKKSENG